MIIVQLRSFTVGGMILSIQVPFTRCNFSRNAIDFIAGFASPPSTSPRRRANAPIPSENQFVHLADARSSFDDDECNPMISSLSFYLELSNGRFACVSINCCNSLMLPHSLVLLILARLFRQILFYC